jgi:hypothetical protein
LLQNNGVAGGQGGSHFRTGEEQREIPRHDSPDHAQRLARDVVQEAGFDRDDGAPHFVGDAAEVTEHGGGAGDIEVPGVADRMACIEAFEFTQVGRIGFDGVRQFQKEAAAVGGGHALPRREGFARGIHGAIDIDGGGFCHFREKAVVVRVVDGDEPAFGCADELAPYEETSLDGLNGCWSGYLPVEKPDVPMMFRCTKPLSPRGSARVNVKTIGGKPLPSWCGPGPVRDTNRRSSERYQALERSKLFVPPVILSPTTGGAGCSVTAAAKPESKTASTIPKAAKNP